MHIFAMFLIQVTSTAQSASTVVAANVPQKPVPTGLRESLNAGRSADVIVEFNADAIDEAAAQLRAQLKVSFAHRRVMELRQQRNEALKTAVLSRLSATDFRRVKRYSHLPLELLRLNNASALQTLLDSTEVKAIYRDELKYPVLDSADTSLISLSAANTAGLTGAGTTVAVIDTGVNYTNSDFGCSSPGVPGTCKVNYYQNFADSSTAPDSNGHGSNVSGIVVGVAPGAKVAGLNVFGAGSSAFDSTIIAALNWALANQVAYNIVAVNMSLGDSVNHGATCSGTAYDTPAAQLRLLGVEIYVASGNNGFNNGVSKPACVTGVNAVGAVYSRDIGVGAWSTCTDSTTAADKATCFSNLPPSSTLAYKFLLAPGINIIAGGYIASGTSQATPFAAGAQALIAAAIPEDMPTQFNRDGQSSAYYMNSASGVNKTIARAGYSGSLQRLDLAASISAAGDSFAAALSLPLVANNVGATKESGEPNHAGNAGGKSVWGKWTAPYTGSVQIDTHGSSFDTLLGVYTGVTVASLTPIAANDDDGSSNGNSAVIFQAQAGTEYKVAVDGKNGAAGVFGMSFAVPNDNFSSASMLPANSGTLVASNWFATAESGEPAHAGFAAKNSVWWHWTAPASGQFSLNTHGSSVDTVLQVVTGSSVTSTTNVVANDNDGAANGASGVVFSTSAGTDYKIAIDAKGATGQLALAWNFTSILQADLTLGLAGGSAEPGSSFQYAAAIANAGPASANAAQLAITLPSGVSYQSASRSDGGALNCTQTGQALSCALGTLYAGDAVTVYLTVVATAAANYLASGVVSSAVADPAAGNNSASATEYVAFFSSVADAPTLPQWAALLLGTVLLLGVHRLRSKLV
jgi:uncharacterized repeat protein (TIGR01451 family)